MVCVNSNNYGKKGFSLLELVAVLAVMGTLAAVAVPTFKTVAGKSKSSFVVVVRQQHVGDRHPVDW